MMPNRIAVSLSELMEVRADGLTEDEVLALLHASATPLIALVKEARQSEVIGCAIGPGTIFLLDDGSVQLKPVHRSGVDDRFIPPEYCGIDEDEFDDPANHNALDIEKVLVYSLGAVLLYGLEQEGSLSPSVSPQLLSLINLMTVADPKTRPSANRLQQMSETRIEAGGINCGDIIQSLHTSIMGDDMEDYALEMYDDEDLLAIETELVDPVDSQNVSSSDNSPHNIDSDESHNNHNIQHNGDDDIIIVHEQIILEGKGDNFADMVNDMNFEKYLDKIETTEPSLDLHISEEEDFCGLGSPIGHSTQIADPNTQSQVPELILDQSNHNTLNESDWINFETPKENNEEKDLSDIFGTPLCPESVVKSVSVSSEEKTENTLDDDKNNSLDAFNYDRLKESLEFDRAHDGDPFRVSTVNEQFNHAFDKIDINDKPILQDLTSPKDHGILESCRSHHSVDCQFCSPHKTPINTEDNKSMPNLSHENCDSPSHEILMDKDRLFAKKIEEDPFASFDDLSNSPAVLKEERREKIVIVTEPQQNHMIQRKQSDSDEEHTTSHGFMSEKEHDIESEIESETEPEPEIVHMPEPQIEIEPVPLSLDEEGVTEMQIIFNNNSTVPEIQIDSESDSEHVEEETLVEQPCVPVAEPEPAPIPQPLVEEDEPTEMLDTKSSSSPSPAPRLYQQKSPVPKRRAKSQAPNVPPPLPPPRRLSNASSYSHTEDEGEMGEFSPSKQTNSQTPKLARRKSSVDSSGSGEIKPVAAPRAPTSFKRAGSVRRSTTSLRVKSSRPTSQFQPPISEVLVDGSATIPRASRKHKVMHGPTQTGPEFLHSDRLPQIRLKAPANKRRKLLSRLDMNSVQVMLLNGQHVLVECRTDAIAADVFDLVVTHVNLSEHFFFGLTVLQDGEHFFLEPDCKLSKYAPPGWKHARKNRLTRVVYTIFLRLKYYPFTLDFIKMDHTLHEMYLQLRRDLIDERTQIDRDSAYSLAAVALQAEFGDRLGEKIDYFQTEHYLPHHHLAEELGGEARIRSNLSELHSQYAGMSQQDAEMEFLKQCTQQKEYSIHFHRLYKTKPSHNLVPTPLGDPETGTLLWVGIMPKGVIVFEERRGQRVPLYQHPWHTTQTLQFDRKKFVVVAQNSDNSENGPNKHIYFTDSYKKSSYFVNFAAAQHRFCMKMRNWAATLSTEPAKPLSEGIDVRVNGHRVPSSSGQSSLDSGVPDMSREASPDDPQYSRAISKPGAVSIAVNEPSPNKSMKLNTTDASISDSFAERIESASQPSLCPTPALTPDDFVHLSATLKKDPQYGLGLTLVDGEIKGIKGVYVKSLIKGGPAENVGRLKIGDKLTVVNGMNLDKRDRHYVVSLVHQADEVVIEALRLRDLYSGSEESIHKVTAHVDVVDNSQHGEDSYGSKLSSSLPMYRSQDIDEALKEAAREEEDRSRNLTLPNDTRLRTRSASENSHISSSHSLNEDNGEFNVQSANQSLDTDNIHLSIQSNSGAKSYFDKKSRSNVSEILYNSHFDTDSEGEGSVDSRLNQPQRVMSRENMNTQFMNGGEQVKRVRNELDWADDISMGDSNLSWDDQLEQSDPVQVVLPKNGNGGLGIKIAGGNNGQKRVYIKALVAEPAMSCTQLRPGDRLITVNYEPTEGKSHQDVVSLLKNASSPVTLGLLRRRSTKDLGVGTAETITVTLEKSPSGSLGLSLARPTGGRGIYVRVINEDSPAAKDGTVKVGDRLIMINEDNVEEASTYDVVEKLRAAQTLVTLVVKREL